LNEITNNPGTRRIVERQTDQALMKRGVPLTSPVKVHIQERVRLVWAGRDAEVRVPDDNGRSFGLDDYLEELRLNPEFAAYFPKTGPQISISDEAGINANVMRIARGELQVIDDRD
jgi:hypothetical protein